jgi:hypothetical protein
MAQQIIKDKNLQRAKETKDMRKSVVDMVSEFKKKSMSRQRKQMHVQSAVFAAHQVNLSKISCQKKDSLINSTYDALIQDRVLQGQTWRDPEAVRKKVVLLLIEVLKLRK